MPRKKLPDDAPAWWNEIVHFHPLIDTKLSSPDDPESWRNLKQTLMERADEGRQISGVPWKINSGYRTAKRNREVGGKRNSAHRRGYALDVACTSSRARWKILEAAILIGFHRIGISKTFIHLDCDPELPPKVVWLYD